MVDYTEGAGYQYHIGVRKGEVGKYVILPGDPKRCRKIAEFFDDPVLVADSREFVTYTGTLGTCGGMQTEVCGGDLVIATGAIRMEGTSREYAPIEYPAVPDLGVTNALVRAAQKCGAPYHTGVVQCKDSFYGQHQPQMHPVSYELTQKWDAWIKMGCMASEMESAALFITGAYRRVKVGSVFLVIANQEREKQGLPNVQVHDTETAIRTAVEAIREMILEESYKVH